MELQKEQISSLQMHNLHFEAIHFTASGNQPSQPTKMTVAFNVNKKIEDRNRMNVELECNIDIPEIASVQVKLAAEFKTDDMPVEKMLKNALAIMFPYLRSQVTLITTQPNFKPIILPVVNINQLVK
ncbi:protein-export chaperone SecB [Acidaminococcus timonensis]|jgi:preprotein translocase subunit SecB|uniref:protein-export chaperone SecB n=1 Tax=Acidaminococcus TaxID=904 RepID=UPI0025D78B7F|nr:protein-export chaperone SecB [Acidaminococcus timonensis]